MEIHLYSCVCFLVQLVFASCTKSAFDGTSDTYCFKQRKIAKETSSMTAIKQARFCEEGKEKGHRSYRLFTKMP